MNGNCGVCLFTDHDEPHGLPRQEETAKPNERDMTREPSHKHTRWLAEYADGLLPGQ
jgi:hypothetical protein